MALTTSGEGANSAATPIEERRLHVVDALRGFALLGILVVNSSYVASTFRGTGVADPAFTSTADTMVTYSIALLFETKFYLLFSFLFGYSFTIQRQSAVRRGTRFTGPFLRRLGTLFLIGAAHAVLLFVGDILTTYAMLGLILLALRGLRPRTAVTVATAVLVAMAAVYAGLGHLQAAAGGSHTLDAGAVTRHAQELATLLAGSPGQVIAANLQELPTVAAVLLLFQAPAALAMFLLGLAAGTRTVLADPMRHRGALRRIQWIGLPVGLLGGVIYAHTAVHWPGTPYEVFALALDLLTAPALAAAYGATLLLILHGPQGDRITGALAPAGRMALSNYLLQSVLLALVFTGYGFALVGQLAPAAVLALSLAIYAVQLGLSRYWMRTHVYGPVEWILRAVTNLNRPRWRRPR